MSSALGGLRLEPHLGHGGFYDHYQPLERISLRFPPSLKSSIGELPSLANPLLHSETEDKMYFLRNVHKLNVLLTHGPCHNSAKSVCYHLTMSQSFSDFSLSHSYFQVEVTKDQKGTRAAAKAELSIFNKLISPGLVFLKFPSIDSFFLKVTQWAESLEICTLETTS